MTGQKRQKQERFLCSELVNVKWSDSRGCQQESVVNLEEIWRDGAVLQFEVPPDAGMPVSMTGSGPAFCGVVKSFTQDCGGYLVEVEFAEDCRWSREEYEPEHFFDPQRLVETFEHFDLMPNGDLDALRRGVLAAGTA